MRNIYEIGFINDYEKLPKAIKKELCFGKMDDLSEKIIDVLNFYEGVANIDEIIVGMYRMFEVIKTRDYYVGKLYKMAKNNLINSVKGKKGIYTTLEYNLLYIKNKK